MGRISEPNTVCRNMNCTNGENGARKKFYACLICLKRASWKAYCCCFDCYTEYTQQIAASREKKLPERTDMSAVEIEQVMKMPESEVAELTLAELSEYKSELESYGYAKVVEMVNAEIGGANVVKEAEGAGEKAKTPVKRGRKKQAD